MSERWWAALYRGRVLKTESVSALGKKVSSGRLQKLSYVMCFNVVPKSIGRAAPPARGSCLK